MGCVLTQTQSRVFQTLNERFKLLTKPLILSQNLKMYFKTNTRPSF